jgi:hypothetical protein
MNEQQSQGEFGPIQGRALNLILPNHSQNDLVPPSPTLILSSHQSHHSSVHALHTNSPNLTQVIQQLRVVMLNSVADAILHARGCDSATPASEPHGSEPKANLPAEFDSANC